MTWSEKSGFIVRRFIETILIMVISSVPVYLLAILGVIPNTKTVYIISFGISAVLFLVLSGIFLYRHLWGVCFNVIKYLIVNFIIFIMMAGMNYVLMKFKYIHLNTALFGYTKPFRRLFGVSDIGSAAFFWIIYIILIFAIILEVFFFDWRYKEFQNMESEIEEETDEMEEI